MTWTIIIAAAAIISAAFAAYAFWIAPFRPTVTRTRVEVLASDSPFEGFKVLHLSDFHLRRETNPKLMEGVAALADQLSREDDIDLICVTGDIIETDTGIRMLDDLIEKLHKIGATSGMFAILGNHDYNHYPFSNLFLEKYIVRQKNDTARLVSTLEQGDIAVLRNQTRVIKRDGSRLVVIGIDDFISGRHCLQACFEAVEPTDTVIFLTHSPDVVSYLLDRKVDLVLAGHTHGGQMCLPVLGSFVSRSRVFRRLASGLFRVGDMFIFITRGLGIVRYAPFRFRCAPEFAILELCKKPGPSHEEAA
ncbi:MAG: metallophosphoesterase [Candidatus Coatesbacteria bacterium]|nr:metallophosphoesterase [Candidatus Coatesbacteria bacterium]